MFTGADASNASPGPNVVPYNSNRFNAMPWDPGSGQYNMGARNYQPGTGSFDTSDMYAGAGADMALTSDPFSGGAYAFGDANPISNIELDGHSWCSWRPAGCGVATDVTSAFASGYHDATSASASGYHDFINVARSAGHGIAAGARVVMHGIVAAAKVVGSATGITDAINCVRNPTLVGCLTAVGKLALTASAFADGGASLGLEAELEGGSLLAEEGLNVAADEAGSAAADAGSNIVYRGLAEGENPAAGLTARAPGATDVSPISHVAGKIASPWISTTKSLGIATTKYGKFGVVGIDLSKVSSEVVDISGGFPESPGMFSNWAIKDQEVLIRDFVPPEAIFFP